MKKIIVLVLFAVSLLVSCDKNPTIITSDSNEFSGKMTVTFEGEEFEQNSVNVLAELNDDQTLLDIKLKKVKFVPSMPVTIDVTIYKIPVIKQEGGVWSFYGDGITPWALGGEYSTFRVDNLSGTLTESELKFTVDFFQTKKEVAYPTSYSGTIKEK